VLSTKDGPLFIDLETYCRGPVEFDLAHVPEAVCEHYPGVDQGLLDECRQLVLAMVAAWRWRLATSFRTGGDSEKSSCACCARDLRGRPSTGYNWIVCRERRRPLERGKEPSGEAVAVATHVMAGTRISAPPGRVVTRAEPATSCALQSRAAG
jgi:hypothetical protein